MFSRIPLNLYGSLKTLLITLYIMGHFVGVALPLSAQYTFIAPGYVHPKGDTGTLSLVLSEPAPVSNKLILPPKETWNGPYRFESKQERRVPTLKNENYIETGYFIKGQESGDWNYAALSSEVEIDKLVGSSLQYRVQTELESLKGNWRKGVRNGNWVYERIQNPVENKVVLERLEFQFENGWLNGPLNYANYANNIQINGRIQEGMMVGDWTFRYGDTLLENRLYEKGVLISLEKISKSDTINAIFPLSSRCLDALKSRVKTGDLTHYPMSLTFSDGYPQQSEWIAHQEHSGGYLSQVEGLISRFLPEWRQMAGLSFGTNRCIYPLNAQEETDLSTWLERSQEWLLRVQELQDTLENIALYPQQTAYCKEVSQWIAQQKSKHAYTQKWREIMESGRLVYYNRNGLLLEFAQKLLNTDTLQTAKGIRVLNYTQDGINLNAYLVRNTESRLQQAKTWLDSSLAIQKRYELSRFMLQLSQNIQSTHDSLIRTCVVDTLPYGPFYGYLRDFSIRFLGEAFERRYQNFLSESEIQIEQSLGDSLLSDLKRLDQLRYRSLQLEKLWRAIDTFYTEKSIDAFTFERLKIRTKKRLYEQFQFYTYEEIALNENASLQDRLESTMRLRRLFQSFLYLRDKSTAPLERKLARAKTHKERRFIWELIN